MFTSMVYHTGKALAVFELQLKCFLLLPKLFRCNRKNLLTVFIQIPT